MFIIINNVANLIFFRIPFYWCILTYISSVMKIFYQNQQIERSTTLCCITVMRFMVQ